MRLGLYWLNLLPLRVLGEHYVLLADLHALRRTVARAVGVCDTGVRLISFDDVATRTLNGLLVVFGWQR